MRILVAIDGSSVSRRALRAVGPIVRGADDPEVWLFTAIDPDEVAASPATETPLETRSLISERGGAGAPSIASVVEHIGTERRVAESRTQAISRVEAEHLTELSRLGEAELAGVSARVHVELDEHPGQAILDFAEHRDIDLIAIGTHGRTGLAHLLAGSVAEHVIRHAKVPVPVVGPESG